jgi:NTP pyrophosphatase (non-canonical NTP hydrolase)
VAVLTRPDVFALVDAERERQRERWDGNHDWGTGDCASPNVDPSTKLVVLVEEVGEVARALLDRDPHELQRELVQVAAVAVAWIEGGTWKS